MQEERVLTLPKHCIIPGFVTNGIMTSGGPAMFLSRNTAMPPLLKLFENKELSASRDNPNKLSEIKVCKVIVEKKRNPIDAKELLPKWLNEGTMRAELQQVIKPAICRMLDISRAGVDRSNTVVCLENGTATTGTNTPHNNASHSSSRKYSTNRPSNGEELREYAHRLCRDYLHGAWLSIHPQEMILKKVSGGLSNLLYYCSLPDSVQTVGTEPHRLLLRLYGNVNSERAIENLITESVIFALLSETQRGPRLYGVFSGGRLEEYIQARPLCTSELTEPTMSALIADKMAQIHLMDVPINKQPKWLWQTMQRWIKQIDDLTATEHASQSSKEEMINSVKQLDLSTEFIWLKEYLTSIRSPVVFCHNDLQEGNILLRDFQHTLDDENSNVNNNNNNNNFDQNIVESKSNTDNYTTTGNNVLTKPMTSEQLVVIDFEYCSYNYRGFDFANHFCEWMYDYSNQDAPYFWHIEANKPTKLQMEHFIQNYLSSLAKYPEYKKREDDTVERIIREVTAFTLASHFFWGLWSVINATASEITFDYWSYGESRFKAYYRHKREIMSGCPVYKELH